MKYMVELRLAWMGRRRSLAWDSLWSLRTSRWPDDPLEIMVVESSSSICPRCALALVATVECSADVSKGQDPAEAGSINILSMRVTRTVMCVVGGRGN